MEERFAKMQEQLKVLEVIKQEKNEYKRELERLHYKVKDLNKHIQKYLQEI